MSKIERFEDLNCWKNARILVKEIYQQKDRFKNDWSTRDQFQRAGISVMNNIAEGFTRFSAKEKIRFLEIAQSSAAEVKSMLYLLEDLKYFSPQVLENLHKQVDTTRYQILGFIKYLNKSR